MKMESFLRYETSACEMHHEKVKLKENGLPISSKIGDEIQYERVTLCPADVRDHRLGCAHSKANITFLNLIDDLKSKDPKVLKMRSIIDGCIVEIRALDHEKGELEKQTAMGLDQLLNEAEKSANEQQIEICVENHTKCIRRLEEARTSLMYQLSKQ